MTDFSIHGFGSLTNKLGKEIKIDLEEIKKFDADGDNSITESELENYVKSLNDDFDASEINKLFKALDHDASKKVDSDEFAIYDQKVKMQETVNKKLAEIAADPELVQHAANIRDSLKEFIDKFAESYTGDVSKMAEEFPAALEKELENIKANIKANDPASVQERVLEEFNAYFKSMSLPATRTTDSEYTSYELLPDATRNRLLKLIEAESNRFRASYTGNNFEADLQQHISQYLSETDHYKMQDAIQKFGEKQDSYGDYISEKELKSLKEDVTEFLQEAIKQGVTINLGGTNVIILTRKAV